MSSKAKSSPSVIRQLLLLLVALLIAIGFIAAAGLISQSPAQQSRLIDHQIMELRSNAGQVLAVEVVTQPASIAQGLSGRPQLGAQGMLFVFDQPGRPVFWMKQMLFDLDLVWINRGEIVAITANVPRPKPNTPDTALPTYQSPQTVEMVLEVAAGDAANFGLTVGQQLSL